MWYLVASEKVMADVLLWETPQLCKPNGIFALLWYIFSMIV